MRGVIVLLAIITLVLGLLIKPQLIYADTVLLNPSSTPENLEDYTNFVTHAGGGEAQTYNSSLFFPGAGGASYETSTFQSSFTFHVTSYPVDPSTTESILQGFWENSDDSLAAGGIVQATTSASFQPVITYYSTGHVFHEADGTSFPVNLPFDMGFTYDGSTVTVYYNSQVVQHIALVSVAQLTRSFFYGQNIGVSSITYTNQPNANNSYVACDVLDIACQLYNFRVFLISLVIPSNSDISTNLLYFKSTLYTKVPFAYLNPIVNLDLSQSTTATSTPVMVLPMESQATSAAMYHVQGSGTIPLTWTGTADVFLKFGDMVRPIIRIGLWLLMIDFIIFIVSIALL